MGWGPLAFVPVILGAIGIGAFIWEKRRTRCLTAKRQGMSPSALLDWLIAAGISEPVADFVWDALGRYYGEGDVPPHPDDDLSEDAGIDPEDIEDFVAAFFDDFSLPQPSKNDPEIIPKPLTLAGFAQYLQSKLGETTA